MYVITGLFPGAVEQHRIDQLAGIQFIQGEHYTELRCVAGSSPGEIGEGKRRVCEELSCVLMFEDRADFVEQIRRTTRCVLMVGT